MWDEATLKEWGPFNLKGDHFDGFRELMRERQPISARGLSITKSYSLRGDWVFVMSFHGEKYCVNMTDHYDCSNDMLHWLEAICLGAPETGIIMDHDYRGSELFGKKLNDKETLLMFWLSPYEYKKETNREEAPNKKCGFFYVKIQTKRLVSMFYNAVLKYIHEIPVGKESIVMSRPLIRESEIIEQFLLNKTLGIKSPFAYQV